VPPKIGLKLTLLNEKSSKQMLRPSQKKFLSAYSTLSALANRIESERIKPAFRRQGASGRARIARLSRHLDRAIQDAETWEDRDKLCRRLSSHCYRTAQQFMKGGDCEQAAKWMNLVLRFLRLSIDPKAREDVDRVEKELADLKAQMSRLEGEQKEQDDGEDNTEG